MASQNTTADGSLARSTRTVPFDLIAVVLLVLVADAAVLLPGIRETPLRAVLGMPLVLFVPGYLLLAILFPGRPKDRPANANAGGLSTWTRDEYSVRSYREKGIDGVERAALSLALSLALVPVFGLILTFTWRLDLVPIVAILSGYAALAAVFAAIRRVRIPEQDRFTLSAWTSDVRSRFFAGEGRDVAINAVLALAIVLAMSGATYAVAVPGPDQSFTDFSVVTQNEQGDFVTSGYPENFTSGEGQQLYAMIQNNEGETTTYTVVVELQRVRPGGDEAQVVEQRRLTTMSATLDDGQTWTARHTVTPNMVGDRLRLTYLVYRGEPPANPTVENAYRKSYIWINVSG